MHILARASKCIKLEINDSAPDKKKPGHASDYRLAVSNFCVN